MIIALLPTTFWVCFLCLYSRSLVYKWLKNYTKLSLSISIYILMFLISHLNDHLIKLWIKINAFCISIVLLRITKGIVDILLVLVKALKNFISQRTLSNLDTPFIDLEANKKPLKRLTNKKIRLLKLILSFVTNVLKTKSPMLKM